MVPLESVSGPIVRGSEEGRALGYPTINVSYSERPFVSLPGVYAARVWIDGEKFQGAAVVGGDFLVSRTPKLEVFLLGDTVADRYGQNAEVELLEFISALEKIPVIDELIKKIEQDILRVKEYFLRD